jgi:hypothetical protein
MKPVFYSSHKTDEDATTKRKLQANLFNEHTCKNP